MKKPFKIRQLTSLLRWALRPNIKGTWCIVQPFVIAPGIYFYFKGNTASQSIVFTWKSRGGCPGHHKVPNTRCDTNTPICRPKTLASFRYHSRSRFSSLQERLEVSHGSVANLCQKEPPVKDLRILARTLGRFSNWFWKIISVHVLAWHRGKNCQCLLKTFSFWMNDFLSVVFLTPTFL